jgi:hypothetical protein
VLALATACGSADRSSAAGKSRSADAAGGAASALPRADEIASSELALSATAPNAAAPAALPALPTMILRSGSASLRVDSLEEALAALTRAATTVGGAVGNTTLSTDAEQVRLATVELRIPAAVFGDAVAALGTIGTVESVNTAAQDVSEEYVDLAARRTNAARLEQRLLTVLSTRTGKLEDILVVERELARVREEIERMDGRARWIEGRAAMSTLTVSLHEPAIGVGPRTTAGVLASAFAAAWHNFVDLVAALIATSGVWLPIGAVVCAGVVAWRGRRRRTGLAASAA